MTSIRVTFYGLFAAACLGCPGTIDDPARYEGYQRPDPDSDGTGFDSGAELEPAPEADATLASDASGTNLGDAAQAGSGDGGLADAGSTTSPLGDGGAAADPGCNFKALMQMKCGSAACHGAPGQSTGLDLTSEGLAVRLSGKRGSDGCEDYLMIDTAQPDQSALYLKVTGNACGVRMPIGGSLSQAEQACILQWIDNL